MVLKYSSRCFKLRKEVQEFKQTNTYVQIDEAGAGKFTLAMFCQIAARFMIEDDEEQMKEELKEAFRIYDRDGQGFITTDVSASKLYMIYIYIV